MFETLTKIKNWIVGIFAVIGGIAVVWALKKDTRSEKEFKADLKKIKGEGKKLDKKIQTRETKVTKLQEDLNKAKEELTRSRLKIGKISYQQNEDLVPYTVLAQSISPGTVLDQSSQINLVISILDLQDIFDKLENEK